MVKNDLGNSVTLGISNKRHIILCIGLFKMFSRWIWGIFTFKYRVKGGANSCILFVILKLKTSLILISGLVVHSV